MRVNGTDERLSEAETEVPAELIRTLLSVLRSRLGLDTAWLSTFNDGSLVFEVLDGDAEALGLSPGTRLSLSGSYCVRVVDGRLPSVIADTSANEMTASLAFTRDLRLGSYVGVPVLGPDGATIGTVCAVSQEARPDLADVDLRIVKHIADLIGVLIEPPVRESGGTPDMKKARCVAAPPRAPSYVSMHPSLSARGPT